MSCEVTLTDKIKLKNQKKAFSSEEAFDSWLFENRVAISKQIKDAGFDVNKIDPTFAITLSPIDQRKANWENFQAQMASMHSRANDTSGLFQGAGMERLITMGATTMFKYIGNASDVMKPVNDFGTPEEQRKAFVDNQKVAGISEVEANKRWENKARQNKLVSIDGTIFGALIQDALTNSTKDIDNLRNKASFNAELKSIGLTFDQALNRVSSLANTVVKQIKSEIYSVHGTDAKIFTEVEVFSKQLSKDFKAALDTASLHSGRKDRANTINGFIDVVVQDKSGELHMYDIKLSTHKAQDWWSPFAGNGNWKYNEISAQQMAYATMAKQWGINFNSINIIPANAEYDSDGNLKAIARENFRTFSLTNPYAYACENYFPIHTITDSHIIKNLSKITEELYPGLQLDSKAQTVQFTKDFVMQKLVKQRDGRYILKLDSNFDEGNTLLNKEVSYSSREEMEKFVEEEYIPKINKYYSMELRNFASDFRRIANSNKSRQSIIDDLMEVARGITKDKSRQEWIVNKFKKYAIQHWDLVSDNENLLADYGIFIFRRNGLAEIIMIDKTDLYGQVQLGKSKNSTVLGNVRHDLANGMDDINIMKSLRGNLMLMKAMAFVSQNDMTLFNGVKIQAVKAMNLRWGQEIHEANDKLINNWNTLVGFYNIKSDTKLRTIDNKVMLSSPLAYVNLANDIAETFLTEKVHFKGHLDRLGSFSDDSGEEILRYMRNLAAEYNVTKTEDWSVHTDAFEAYKLLNQAYLATRGWYLSVENDVGDYISNRIFLSGTRSSSPAESPAVALRIFNQIETTYEQKLRDTFRDIVQPWQNLMAEVYAENGGDGLWGNERNFFKMCFEKDTNENISQDFCLIPPDQNPYLANKPKLKALVKMFLEKINEIRIPNENEREALSLRRGSVYYQVPLTEANFRQQAIQGGLINALRTKGQNIFSEMKNFAYGHPMSNWEIKQFNDVSKDRIYDPYLNVSEEAQRWREEQLSGETVEGTNKKYGVSVFETSLDTVFLKAMASALRARVSEEFMPLFTGVRTILAFNNNVNGAEIPGITKAVDDFIKSAVFGKLIIEPANQTIYHIMGLLRNITSVAALAFNSVSFTREMLTSTLRTSINKEIDPLMKGQFSESEYVSAIFDIIENAHKNADVRSKYMQLNFIYGLANAAEEHLATASKSGRINPSNWTDDILFATSTMPDFVHRNGIMVAYLKHRGSWDAYVMNDDKKLVYDMSKDKFYEIFWKYKDKYHEITDDKTKKKFKEQETYYRNALDDWNRHYGMELNYGDTLPQALSPSESNGVRVYADHLYGNYDKNTKSLLAKSLLGSIVLQFKTYSLAQFLQNVRDTGYINVTRQWHVETDDGKKIYRVYSTTPEEIQEHGIYRLMAEDALDGIDPANIEPVIVMAGSPTGGKMATNLELMKDVLFNRDKFVENWKNDGVYRANLYISLIDNLGMLFVAMLLRLMYGEDTIKDIKSEDWWTRWSYTVLMGVAQDGPIDQVINGLIGNGTPPSIAVLQTFYRNAYNVITGEDAAIVGFMKSFGATRQFSGIFNNAR